MALGLAGGVALLVCWEVGWRARGFTPHVVDDQGLWIHTLRRGLAAGDDAVFLLGSSRSMQAVHVPTLRAAVPGCVPAQLGASMGSPLPAFELLAQRQDVVGTVVVEVTPRLLFTRPAGGVPTGLGRVRAFLQQEQHDARLLQPAYAGQERAYKTALQETLVLAGSDVTLLRVLDAWRQGDAVWPPFFWVTRDRVQILDYTRVDVEPFRQSRAYLHAGGEVLPPAEVAALAERFAVGVRSILGRGGRVVFLRFPALGGVRAVEADRFPDADYWLPFAAGCGGDVVDGTVEPTLQGFGMRDDDHVDPGDAPAFTRALAAILWPSR